MNTNVDHRAWARSFRGFSAMLVMGRLLLSLDPQSTRAAEPELCALRTDAATFTISGDGALAAVRGKNDARNYVAQGQPAPLLSLRIGGQLHSPDRAAWDRGAQRLTLHYATGESEIRAIVSATTRPTHIVFEVIEVLPADGVELVLWGPYPTTIGDIIGEVVGVVRDPDFAIGIQALNAKTLGGYPAHESDMDAGYTADDPGQYPDLPPELNKEQLFRGDTARKTAFGSVLQAYCRNRDRERITANWGHEKFVVPPYNDGGVKGSRIALFACPAARALETIGAIELAEGLPHPMLDGVWAKAATNATCSYLIVDFSESTIDRAIEMTRRAGLNYLYHGSPFETWGHFKLKPSLFPNGWDGLRACVEKARKAGVRIGFHTLSNFITPNDPYVSPKPDPRLACIGASVLAEEIDAAQKEIPVASPDFFKKRTDMNTVVIGQELIRYGSVSEEAPWRLLGCERGAWGTEATAHENGARVGKLMDHGYKVFLTDADLTVEVARKIARLCNYSGTLQISLDGLEGAWSTGMGQYGRTLLTHAWFNALKPELQGQINDASNPGHFNWHIYTRMNWGEPWYAGFRESQTLYRFKNQLHYDRNLMPRMLGWFALRPDTSIEDAEWLLARAAGFEAGFALATSLASTAQLEADPNSADAARQFGATPAILAAIREWETARLSGAFPARAKARLRDNTREFHLEPAGPGRWNLLEFHIERSTQSAAKGEGPSLRFTNPYAAQPLQWMVRNTAKQALEGLVVGINGRRVVSLQEIKLPAGGWLKHASGDSAAIYDSSWKELARLPVDLAASQVLAGRHEITVDCAAQESATLNIELRTVGSPIRIGARE
ncbi:MAG: hypothetical protein AB9869_16055 [Verrucomicrobiia bacterium]